MHVFDALLLGLRSDGVSSHAHCKRNALSLDKCSFSDVYTATFEQTHRTRQLTRPSVSLSPSAYCCREGESGRGGAEQISTLLGGIHAWWRPTLSYEIENEYDRVLSGLTVRSLLHCAGSAIPISCDRWTSNAFFSTRAEPLAFRATKDLAFHTVRSVGKAGVGF